MDGPAPEGHNLTPGEQLREHFRVIEHLEEQKRDTAQKITARYKLAKSQGHKVRAMRRLVALRRMHAKDREYLMAVEELYMKHLGMMGDKPLSTNTINQIMNKGNESDDQPGDPNQPFMFNEQAPDFKEAKGPEPDTPPAPRDTREMAVEKGRTAAAMGKPIIANPYPAHDPLRAAWEEGWCEEMGDETGAGLPPALRRDEPSKEEKRAKKAKEKADKADKGGDEGNGGDA